ncbi:hypothetical protein [Deinococcus soli (ex Cha et al. 2016)]|uniref:Uncharacterized protein n=2 Tax=Deinococcus soli (ex Cha et al. 2016) TaxID=1309411 RepID=A0ACC6KGB9_9DEIO|nr:hypothetical protein [Deinococcus soli (ex Cha et al. 2016)]MDR6218545.1 hypothetical protein [Deinococcus soli (ex Cha et al. 2016)]MDR6329285.1 hypothetical protein [Deinococcus soli (ex Cha et al. 2016)]MDR6751558.1 hypothetical protein [Deinococcus soli (ex Cha et al. 2016)]
MRASAPFTVTVRDDGSGTFELGGGSTFRRVNGRWATRASIRPGATFHVGRNGAFLITVQAVLTPWA